MYWEGNSFFDIIFLRESFFWGNLSVYLKTHFFKGTIILRVYSISIFIEKSVNYKFRTLTLIRGNTVLFQIFQIHSWNLFPALSDLSYWELGNNYSFLNIYEKFWKELLNLKKISKWLNSTLIDSAQLAHNWFYSEPAWI